MFRLLTAGVVLLLMTLTPNVALSAEEEPAQTVNAATQSEDQDFVFSLKKQVVYSLPREVQEYLGSLSELNDYKLLLPSPEILKEALEELKEKEKAATTPDPALSQRKDRVQRNIESEEKYSVLIKDEQQTDAALNNNSLNAENLERELNNAKEMYSKEIILSEDETKDLHTVNEYLSYKSAALEQVQADLNNYAAKQASLQSLPTRAQNVKSANNDRIFEINRSFAEHSLSEEDKLSLALEAYVLQYESMLLQKELQSVTFFQDFFGYRTRIQNLHKEYLLRYIAELRTAQNGLLTSGVNDTIDNEKKDYSNVPALQEEIKFNTELSQYINDCLVDQSKLTREMQLTEAALNTSYQIKKSIQLQISDISESLLLSRLLNRQQSDIPDIDISFNLDEMITNLTISLYDLKTQRDELFDVKVVSERKIKGNSALAAYPAELEDIIRQRHSLFDQLYRARSDTLSLAVDLRDRYGELTEVVDEINTIISDNLFWLASNTGLSLEFILSYKDNVQQQLSRFAEDYAAKGYLQEHIKEYLKVLLPLLVIAFIFYRLRTFFYGRISRYAMRLDHNNDGYGVTPLSLFFHLFTVIPLLCLLTAFGALFIFFILHDEEHKISVTCLLALHLMCFLYIRNILSVNSLAQRHFSFPPHLNARNRKIVDQIWFFSIPMLLIANIRILEPTMIAGDILGYTFMLSGFIYLTVFAFRTAKRHFENYNPTLSFWIISTVGCLTPLTLSIMLSMGYYYTVIQLLNRVAITLYIFFLYFITSNTLRRELYVAENKMLQAVRQKALNIEDNSSVRKSGNKRKEDEGMVRRNAQVSAMRLDLVNTRSFKLFNVFLLCVFLYFMYMQWSDLAGVLNYLDRIYLWTDVSEVNGREVVTEYMPLGNLLFALITVVVTTILTRNLPPLLERLFLLKSTGNRSISYTVRIISTYLIASIGTILTAGYMGISWDSLQWLVAALSVGLGFGLQEIFGNFVSGIIILFERQMRVGDIVTLNALSGKVTKIRIRATTIEAFDNKEVVIPNKQFITEPLTNWSLSNTITKIEFAVGVAYDTDVPKAKDLLRGIVRRCRTLSRDRKPVVYVKSLDASAVTIMCEVHVNEIGKRKETYDFLSIETLRVFKENNIEIPFNQLDVTVRNLDTLQTYREHIGSIT